LTKKTHRRTLIARNRSRGWKVCELKDLEPLLEMIRLTLLTAYIRGVPKPNSLLIIARPESGKTEALKKFTVNKNAAYLTDVTGFGIQRDWLTKIEAGEVRHIIIPDLLKPLSRKESTVNSFITMLNSLIEEGVSSMSTYATPGPVIFKKPVKCGLITAITSDEFSDNRHNWKKKGFLSRTIPFSYKYGMNTVTKVFNSIVDLDYNREHKIKLDIPKQDVEIKLNPKYAKAILPSTATIARAQETYGFRLQKQFQALLQASALDRKRRAVNSRDVDRILHLMNWVNFDENEIAPKRRRKR
jgi:hypothetical protein